MSEPGTSETHEHRHGNIFSRHSGSMLIHIQRESGLAHRTIALAPWKVQVLRVVATRWFVGLLIAGFASWVFFAVQTTRVPLLTARLAHMEEDARRLDTLQQALARLQGRYDQVQRMLSAPSAAAVVPGSGVGPRTPRSENTGAAATTPKKDSATRTPSVRTRPDSSARKRSTKGDSATKTRVP